MPADRHPIDPLRVFRRTFRETVTDRTMMVAAGLTFFVLFSLLPATAAAGLVFIWLIGPAALEAGVAEEAGLFPEGTPRLLEEFLTVVPQSLTGGLGLALNLLVVLWMVQRAASGLITALNVVYDEDERRHRARREAVALAIAGGGLAFLFVTLLLLTVLPGLASLGAGGPWDRLLPLRWPLWAAVSVAAVALIYRFAACRGDALWRHVLSAAAFTTGCWIATSLLFTLYMNTVGGWDEYYGTVTTPVVVMTWMFIGSFVLMLGAELNAQLEAAAHPDRHAEATKKALDRRERAG